MKISVLAASAAVAMSLSVAAHAKAFTAIDVCEMLGRDFDQVLMLFPTAPNADAAKQQRDEAANLCAAGNPADGNAKLLEAFQSIGITPPDYPWGR